MSELLQLSMGGTIALLLTREAFNFVMNLKKNGNKETAPNRALENVYTIVARLDNNLPLYHQEYLHKMNEMINSTNQVVNRLDNLYNLLVEQRLRDK